MPPSNHSRADDQRHGFNLLLCAMLPALCLRPRPPMPPVPSCPRLDLVQTLGAIFFLALVNLGYKWADRKYVLYSM